LKKLFLTKKESKKLAEDYKKGKILSGEMKKMFADKAVEFVKKFQSNLKKVSDKDVDKAILKND
jgi:tryptophanyl-tRNA synthetase